MAMPQPRQPVKLICGLMWAKSIESSLIEERLDKEFGPIESRSPILSFDHTDYYESEFGPGLKKLYLSFEFLVALESIPSCKHWTNHLERELSQADKRRVNIDPGYLADAKLVLVSAKNLAHRIHIGMSIFADLQLAYRGNTFEPLPTTFPDMARTEIIQYFNAVRERYFEQLGSLT